MPYKIGFKLDNGKMLWLTKTYASKSYAEKVMKRERQTLLNAGVKLNVPYIVPVETKIPPETMTIAEEVIKNTGKKAVAMVKEMPNVSTARYPQRGRIEVKGNPYRHNYSDLIKDARRYFKDAVVVVCYNIADLWATRKAAMDFYTEGIYACEGSERDRYVNVVLDLKSGKDVARDEWY